MVMDLDPVSRWYVLSKGFKTYNSCPKCESENIKYNKVRSFGYAGIASQCLDCKKMLPMRFKAVSKSVRREVVSSAEALHL